MAVKSVTSENVAEFVQARQALGSQIATPEAVAAQEAKVTEEKVEGGKIVGTVTETVSTAPDPGSQEPTAKAKPKNGVQERIDEITREKKELEELAESEYDARVLAQRRVAELEAQIKPKVEEKKDDRPDRTKYKPEEADKYENDLLAWNRRQAIAEFQAESAKQALQARLTAAAAAARQDFSDFDQVIQRAARSTEAVPSHVGEAIQESEVAGHLAYHLAKHPAEAKKIFGLTRTRALLELGRIEEQYVKKPAADKPAVTTIPPVTKAPPPVPAIDAGSGEVSKDISGPMAFADYKRRRIEEIRKARRR